MDMKANLLAHYARKKPKRFVQIDADGKAGMDSWAADIADGDGVALYLSHTTELMHGLDTRVLIPLGTEPAAAVLMLRKIADWLEHDGESLMKDEGQETSLAPAEALRWAGIIVRDALEKEAAARRAQNNSDLPF